MNNQIKNIIEKIQRNEITEYFIYNRLSQIEKDPKNKQIFRKIAEEEYKHYTILKKYSQKEFCPNKIKIFIYLLLTKIFGFTFILKLMEKGEDKAIGNYQKVISFHPEIFEILEEEKNHEQELLNILDEERLKYVSSMVLGLSDALVELTGTLAGLTFAFKNTKLIFLSGFITGIAASLSMASSEYLSIKTEETSRNPFKAAIFTGLTYILTVLILVLPYLLTSNYIVALFLAIGFSIILVGIFNFYISIAKELEFSKRFWEMIVIIFSVSLLTFIIGFFIKKFLAIE